MNESGQRPKTIAVDFDGTLCESRWPEIGEPRYGTIAWVKAQKENGAKLILWTNRVGDRLDEAVAWCGAYGLHFDAVNENLPEVIAAFGGDTRKIVADFYLDDKAVRAQDVEQIMQGTVPAVVRATRQACAERTYQAALRAIKEYREAAERERQAVYESNDE